MADAVLYTSNHFPSKIICCKNSSKRPLCTHSRGCVWRHCLEQELCVSLPARSIHCTDPPASTVSATSPKRAKHLNPFPSCLISWSLQCSFTPWWEGFWQGPTFSTAAEIFYGIHFISSKTARLHCSGNDILLWDCKETLKYQTDVIWCHAALLNPQSTWKHPFPFSSREVSCLSQLCDSSEHVRKA